MTNTLKLRVYEVVSRAVDEGISYGLNRAYKYADNPTREDFEERIRDAVMSALCDVVDFDS